MTNAQSQGNLLGLETSPYLLQHRDNPVHWRAWSTETLKLAQSQDRPILLSIGYAACHWCHVMAHESFEDEETASVMNRLFVNIKVDREERPDLDAIYQSALALLGEQGGWPLTMFLTPWGEPFCGGTYFPKEPRYGRPAFRDVLTSLSEAYRTRREAIAKNVDALASALAEMSRPRAGGEVTTATMDEAARRLLQAIDFTHGGMGGAPKFPQPSLFQLLWRAYRRTGDVQYKSAVTLTLDRMSQGGIYDHLGGGFARYATDDRWLVPHFEKMLYDNAQLIDLLTLVWQETRNPLYSARIEETVNWLLREMIAEGDAFAASLDADSEGEEGKFYVWTEADIDRLLGDDAAFFKDAYDVTSDGNWEGHTILNRSRRMLLGDAGREARLSRCRTVLLAERAMRERPERDDKVLADWNGLMIAALANAGAVFGKDAWIQSARTAFSFVADTMTGPDGRLRHAFRSGRVNHPAILNDYADLSRAALALFEATGDNAFIQRAEALVATADQHYWDRDSSGYFFTADDADDVIARTKSATDNAVPPGNATLVGVLARLFYLTGNDAYRERAAATLAAFAGEAARNPFTYPTLLNAAEFLNGAVQIVIIGNRADAGTKALIAAVHDAALPDRVLQVVAPGTSLPQGHPAAGKDQIGGQPTAYICRGPSCSPPHAEPKALTAALIGR
ncbi:MAG: thioredoxin domain-containing protein [Rhodospirillaceae bacterium]|nr:thioredoxin domain-containing protein [Rhodospirillaceae bacterium]